MVVEPGAGEASSFPDEAYVDGGRRRSVTRSARTSCSASTRRRPSSWTGCAPGATLVSLLSPALNPDLVEDLARRPITALAMDAVPRISRAQSLDVLQLDGQHRRLPRGGRGRARVRPVLHRPGDRGGQGAAGQGAGRRAPASPGWPRSARPAAWARSCGRPTRGPRWPTRCGRWVGSTCRSRPRTSRSARPATPRRCREDYNARAAALYAEQAADVDIIITTALIPGRPAPRLITAEMVASMKPGSVIVDMAAANGGNVEGTVAGEAVVTDNGVTIIGYTDLAGPAARAGVPAVRHQPGQPDEAADAGQGRPAGPGLRRRRAAVDDRGPRRRD